jgi:hypothetical protein
MNKKQQLGYKIIKALGRVQEVIYERIVGEHVWVSSDGKCTLYSELDNTHLRKICAKLIRERARNTQLVKFEELATIAAARGCLGREERRYLEQIKRNRANELAGCEERTEINGRATIVHQPRPWVACTAAEADKNKDSSQWHTRLANCWLDCFKTTGPHSPNYAYRTRATLPEVVQVHYDVWLRAAKSMGWSDIPPNPAVDRSWCLIRSSLPPGFRLDR